MIYITFRTQWRNETSSDANQHFVVDEHVEHSLEGVEQCSQFKILDIIIWWLLVTTFDTNLFYKGGSCRRMLRSFFTNGSETKN